MLPQDLGFAGPGDADLDFDVDNLTITALIVGDEDVAVDLAGGLGSWSQPNEGPVAAVPAASDLIERVSVEVTVGLPLSLDVAYRKRYVAILRKWEVEGTLLRLLGTPDRPSTLMEDAEIWLVVPRSK